MPKENSKGAANKSVAAEKVGKDSADEPATSKTEAKRAQVSAIAQNDQAEFLRAIAQNDQAGFLRAIATFHLPRYSQIPDISLYMDQLITYITECVSLLDASGDKPLTPSMVNNYVKQHLVPQPKKKRYDPVHVAYLISVCVLKRTFSIADIDRLIQLEVKHRYQIPDAYDFFCMAFEESLRVLFCGRASVDTIADLRLVVQEGAFSLQVENLGDVNPDRRVAIAAATSAAGKVYVDKQLDWLQAKAVE